jgi:hypothetical protein
VLAAWWLLWPLRHERVSRCDAFGQVRHHEPTRRIAGSRAEYNIDRVGNNLELRLDYPLLQATKNRLLQVCVKPQSWHLIGLICLSLLFCSCGGGGSSSSTPPPSGTVTSVSVSASGNTVATGQTLVFTATVQGTGSYSSAVTWAVNGVAGGNAQNGTISNGTYLAPSTLPSTNPVTVTATSVHDPDIFGSATATVVVGKAPISVSALSPSVAMVGIPVGIVLVLGQGFSSGSLVLVNGQPVNTLLDSSGTLEAQIDPSLNTTPGIYQFSVQTGSTVTNALPYTVYAPQQGPFVMQATPGFLVSENEVDAPFIVAADVNGDSLADVIMPGPDLSNSGSIAVLLGQANGTLSTAQYIPVPLTPYALAVGDVDGNGTADLVSITSDNSSSTTVSILSGDGHGNFQPPTVQQTFAAIFPGPAYLADLDGDGKPDLVLGIRQLTGTVGDLVWLKNTGGGFAAPVTLATLGSSGSFSIADFNLDGRPDILYMASDSSFHLLLNQGNSQFNDQVAGGLTGIVGQANVLDFNLDGIPDLVVQTDGTNGWELISFVGNGKGSFTQVASVPIPTEITLVAGDFDHDGFPDLAGPSGLEPSEILYFFGDGHGNFVSHPGVGPEGELAAVGDFNGDGIPDVVVPDRFSLVSLSLGRTDRNFPSPLALHPATVTEISTGDINGDGLPEIFAGGDIVNQIPGTVFLNQGNGSFQLAANTDPSTFMLADLTGAGLVDLLGEQGAYLEIWPNNKSLNFSSSPITLQQPSEGPLTVVDMDGDGHPDIVANLQIFYGNGTYQFTPISLGNGSPTPYVVGDFNGDGKPDIAIGGTTYLSTGGRTFKTVTQTLPLVNGVITAVADFNGDGKDDVAVNQTGETSIAIYYSNGDGTFYQGAQVDPGQSPGAIVAGDFDGDGRPDLAVGLLFSQQTCILFNAGQGQFTRSFFASGASTIQMIASDMNHDGKTDLVIANFMLDSSSANVNVVFHK